MVGDLNIGVHSSATGALTPVIPIQTPVLHRLRDVLGGNAGGFGQIRTFCRLRAASVGDTRAIVVATKVTPDSLNRHRQRPAEPEPVPACRPSSFNPCSVNVCTGRRADINCN
jgi:hypothetical protein